VQVRKLILLYLLAVSCLLMATPTSSDQTSDWSAYHLDVGNVRACAFPPDSQAVAFLYWNDNLLSEKPWKDVYTTRLMVWSFKTGKVEQKLQWAYTSNNQGDPWPSQPRYMEYSADNRYLVIFDATALRVLNARTYAEVNQVAYEDPKETFPNDGWATVGFSLTPDGSRAAVAISSSIGANGGFVRVYDLGTGKVVREWRLRDGVRYITGVALSSDGERVAASSLPIGRSSDPEAFIPDGVDNVRVMDVKSGVTLTAMNTRYVAGPVLFGPNDTLLTGSINDDRRGYALDTIKVWDARGGNLLREIANPHAGVHYRLDLSPDGKLLLGYTGTEKPVENFVNIDTQQFKVWDLVPGKVIVTSPEFGPKKGEIPRMRLSPDGRFVVVWWGDGFAKPVVYEISQR
jgi:WD40 repeat protein